MMSISVQYQVISWCVHLALVLSRVPGLHPGNPQAPLAAVLAMEDTEPEHEEDEDSDDIERRDDEVDNNNISRFTAFIA